MNSEELNYLVFRYLLESGFVHSTFTFQQEASIHKLDVNQASVRPGALISMLQKSLQYLEVEAHVREDGTERKCIAPFTLLGKHECEFIDPAEYEKEERPIKRMRKEDKKPLLDFRKSIEKKKIRKDLLNGNDLYVKDKSIHSSNHNHSDEPMADVNNEPKIPLKPIKTIFSIQGHQGDVFVGKWNPKTDTLAAGSGDGIARIWTITDVNNELLSSSIPLSHTDDLLLNGSSSKEVAVVCLDWSPNGELLATGSYSGIAKIWTKTGELKYNLIKHKEAICCLSWNFLGDVLVTGSGDNTAIVWDAFTGDVRQQFDFHFAPITDVDWKDNITFATSSQDKTIYVCQLGSPVPLRQFIGHEADINSIRWDPSGMYLASCSDDNTAKIWNMESNTCKWNLTGHKKSVYTLKWFQSKWTKTPVLITGSFDCTLKFWDPNNGSCLRTFEKHTEPIYSISVSPDHKYIVSGASDMTVNVWSAQDGKLIETFKVNHKIYHIEFSLDSEKMAVCGLENHVIYLLFVIRVDDHIAF